MVYIHLCKHNASWIFELTWKRDAMVARLLNWGCNIFDLVIGFSRGPMLELGGVARLRVGLGQYALMELGKLGLLTIVLG
jgi:hypothetical protein